MQAFLKGGRLASEGSIINVCEDPARENFGKYIHSGGILSYNPSYIGVS